MRIEPRWVRPVSLGRAGRLTPRFPPRGPPGRVPPLRRSYQGAPTPCRPSRRTSSPSLGGTSGVPSFCSLLAGRVRRRGLELLTRSLRPGFRRGGDRISQVPGGPRLSVRPVQSTPAGPQAPDRYGAAARPLVSEQQGLPRGVFRRSIAWLSGSLSPLRSAGYPRPAPDSLPAAGPALLDGLSTRRVPMRGFSVSTTSHPPLPSSPGAIGSTDASASLAARVGVVGPTRATRQSVGMIRRRLRQRLSRTVL